MKQGSTFILVVNLDVDITQVYSVIFTLKNKDTILTKENWTYDNGKFKIPFTQEETVQLDGRTRIEAQINFNNRSVAKSEIKDVFILETLATRIIDDNIAIEEQKEIALDIDGGIVNTGSSDYEELSNKPKINGTTLIGDVSLDALNIASKEYVEEEIAKFDFIKVVTELPEVGLPNRIYFVPKSNTSDNDLFDEYAWVNEQWEFYGTKQIEVDLTDYVKKTDFATHVTPGVVAVNNAYGIQINGTTGLITLVKATNKEIDDKTNNFRPITPSSLDYAVMKALSDSKLEWTDEKKQLARALLGAIGIGEYATKDVGGVVKVNNNLAYGIYISDQGILMLKPASKDNINSRNPKATERVPITTSNIDYTVKKALADCKLEGDDVWTEEEKASARDLLGVTELVGDVQTIITELHAYAETLKGGA